MRAMGEGMGRINVNVPGNINVWHKSRGESALATAAEGLTKAVQAMTA